MAIFGYDKGSLADLVNRFDKTVFSLNPNFLLRSADGIKAKYEVGFKTLLDTDGLADRISQKLDTINSYAAQKKNDAEAKVAENSPEATALLSKYDEWKAQYDLVGRRVVTVNGNRQRLDDLSKDYYDIISNNSNLLISKASRQKDLFTGILEFERNVKRLFELQKEFEAKKKEFIGYYADIDAAGTILSDLERERRNLDQPVSSLNRVKTKLDNQTDTADKNILKEVKSKYQQRILEDESKKDALNKLKDYSRSLYESKDDPAKYFNKIRKGISIDIPRNDHQALQNAIEQVDNAYSVADTPTNRTLGVFYKSGKAPKKEDIARLLALEQVSDKTGMIKNAEKKALKDMIDNYYIIDKANARKKAPHLFKYRKLIKDSATYKTIEKYLNGLKDIFDYVPPQAQVRQPNPPGPQPNPSAPDPKKEKKDLEIRLENAPNFTKKIDETINYYSNLPDRENETVITRVLSGRYKRDDLKKDYGIDAARGTWSWQGRVDAIIQYCSKKGIEISDLSEACKINMKKVLESNTYINNDKNKRPKYAVEVLNKALDKNSLKDSLQELNTTLEPTLIDTYNAYISKGPK